MRKRVISVAVAGVGVFALAACINFGPAVAVQASTTSSDRAVDVGVADVTGDGVGDALVLTSTAIVRLAPCGAGCYEREESIPLVSPGVALATADFNGDNISDVAVAERADIRVFFGGAASPTRSEGLVASDSITIASGAYPRNIIAGDLNGDGHNDIVDAGGEPGTLTGFEYDVILGDGAGNFGAPSPQFVVNTGHTFITGLVAADVDGNGDVEGVLSLGGSAFGAVISFGDDPGDNFFIQTPGGVGGLAAGDLNGDGLGDVVARSFPDGSSAVVFWPLRSTGTSWTGFGAGGAVTSIDAGSTNVSAMAVAHVNSDPFADIVFSDAEHNKIAWFHGNGAGGVLVGTARIDRATDSVPGAIALGDFTNDAKPDLIVAFPGDDFAPVSLAANTSL